MTNPLIETLASTIEREAEIANDRREGYADGLKFHYQDKRASCPTWLAAFREGADDRHMLWGIAEQKRRAALAPNAEKR
jgi:hypothetical protein